MTEPKWEEAEARRWTVGRLRADLEGLPDDLPLLVNVSIWDEDSGEGDPSTGFIPLLVVDGGFTVGDGGEDGSRPIELSLLSIYNIETDIGPGGDRLIYHPGHGGRESDGPL